MPLVVSIFEFLLLYLQCLSSCSTSNSSQTLSALTGNGSTCTPGMSAFSYLDKPRDMSIVRQWVNYTEISLC